MVLNHQEKMNKYRLFWDWFLDRSDYIYDNVESDTENIALEITEHLKKIHPDIEFEIPFEFEDEKRTLIISADGDISLFDLVLELVENAPKIMNWEILAFRPRLHQKNQIIDLDGITMDYHNVFFSYKIEEAKLVLDIYIKDFNGSDNRYVHLYFLLLDSLIGEYDSVTLIQETRIYPYQKLPGLREFPELLPIVDQLKLQRIKEV